MKDFKLLSEKDMESGLFSSLPVHGYNGAESLHAHSDRWVHFHHSNLQHPAHIPDAVCVLHTMFLAVPRLCGFFLSPSFRACSLAFLQLYVFLKINPFWLPLSKQTAFKCTGTENVQLYFAWIATRGCDAECVAPLESTERERKSTLFRSLRQSNSEGHLVVLEVLEEWFEIIRIRAREPKSYFAIEPEEQKCLWNICIPSTTGVDTM